MQEELRVREKQVTELEKALRESRREEVRSIAMMMTTTMTHSCEIMFPGDVVAQISRHDIHILWCECVNSPEENLSTELRRRNADSRG